MCRDGFRKVPREDLIKVRIEFYVVFLEVDVKLVCAQNLSNLHELVVVIVSMEEGVFPEDLTANVGDPYPIYRETRTIEANMDPRLHMSRL